MKFIVSLLLLCSFIHLNGMGTGQEQFYVCSCGERYVRKCFLEKHIENHASRKHKMISHPQKDPLSCPLCNETFDQKPSFYNHMKQNHPEINLFPCPFYNCNKEYKYKQNLNVHIQKNHLGQPLLPVVTPPVDQILTPLPIDPRFKANLESWLYPNNSLYQSPQPLDDSLLLEWMHNT